MTSNMNGSRLLTPVKSRGGGTAGERAQQVLFGRSPNWKERFRVQCIEKLNEMRSKASQENITRTSAGREAGSQNSTMWPSSDSYSQESMNTNIQESDAEWMKQFVENELSIFEHFDEDEEIAYQLTLEEHARLCSDLNQVSEEKYYEEEIRDIEEYIDAEERDIQQTAELFAEPEIFTCPRCRQEQMVEDDSSISCSCGLRQDRIFDHMTIEALYHSITDKMAHHSTHCEGQPIFFSEDLSMVSYVFIECPVCKARETAF